MGAPVAIDEYARNRQVSRSAVLRWIRERGAPYITRGGHGPGRCTTVDADALDAWRGLNDGLRKLILEQVADGMLDTLLRAGPEGVPVHRSIGVSRKEAAAMLAFAFERAARRVMGRDIDELPQAIKRIRTIAYTG